MSLQPDKGALGHLRVDGTSLYSVRDNHCATVGAGLHSSKHSLGDCGSGFLEVLNTNIGRSQLTETRRVLTVQIYSTLVPELCLLAQVVNCPECTQLGIFQVLKVQFFSRHY